MNKKHQPSPHTKLSSPCLPANSSLKKGNPSTTPKVTQHAPKTNKNVRRNTDIDLHKKTEGIFSPLNTASNNPSGKFEKISLRNPKKKLTESSKDPKEILIKIQEEPKYIEIPGEPKVYGYSQPGLDFEGKPKTDQDSFLLLDKPFNIPNTAIFGVFDGHGTQGHFVSRHVKDKLNEFCTNKDNFASKSETNVTSEMIYNRLIKRDYSSVKKFVNTVEDQVLNNEGFDAHFSGTTFNLIVIANKIINCVNIGDSRSLLVKMDASKNFSFEPLSVDHKPDLPKEKERILSKGGLVEPCKDDKDGPIRIWVKGESFPGMSISRTIGDEVLKTVGVIDEPEFIERKITEETAYIITGSDGVFELLTNEEIMEIVEPYFFKGDVEGAVKKIIEKSTELWADEGSERDDITCIVYFFKKFKEE